MKFRNRRVVITGAGRDFGRTAAIQFASLGAHVFLSARDINAANATRDTIRQQGHKNVWSFECDITNASSVRKFAQEVSAESNVIDILINNGAKWLEGPELVDSSDEEVVETISSGGLGSVLVTRHFLPLLRRSAAPDIVNMVSICGEVGSRASSAHSAFYASKHAHAGFAEIMSKRLRKEGVRVVSLYPPDFNNLDPMSKAWNSEPSQGDPLTSKSLWGCIEFALTQPRDCYIKTFEFEPLCQ